MGDAAYNLRDLKALVRDGRCIIRGICLETVGECLGITAEASRVFICSQIETLSERNFANTVPPERVGQSEADVYGIYAEKLGWYVKLAIRNNRTVVISFHPPEHPIRTPDGTVKRTL